MGKLIIAGSRNITDMPLLDSVMKQVIHHFEVEEVVCGGAKGADFLGQRWAVENKIPCVHMKANWNKLGKRAGIIRNEQMGRYADALVILWDGSSRGAFHMLKFMRKLEKPTFLHIEGESVVRYFLTGYEPNENALFEELSLI